MHRLIIEEERRKEREEREMKKEKRYQREKEEREERYQREKEEREAKELFDLISSGKLDGSLDAISMYDGPEFKPYMKHMDFSIFKQIYKDMVRGNDGSRELHLNEKLGKFLQHHRNLQSEINAFLNASVDKDTEEMKCTAPSSSD